MFRPRARTINRSLLARVHGVTTHEYTLHRAATNGDFLSFIVLGGRHNKVEEGVAPGGEQGTLDTAGG